MSLRRGADSKRSRLVSFKNYCFDKFLHEEEYVFCSERPKLVVLMRFENVKPDCASEFSVSLDNFYLCLIGLKINLIENQFQY